MTISSNDIAFYLSAPQAPSGFTKPGSPGNSLGLFVSTTLLSATILNNLWPDLSGAQNAADQVDYQCLFVYNGNASGAMLNPVVWLPTGLLGNANTATFQIAADTNNPSLLDTSSAQALAIQTPTLAPSGITEWASPSASSSGGVALPNIPALHCMPVWIKRTATGTAGLNQLGIDVNFDTL